MRLPRIDTKPTAVRSLGGVAMDEAVTTLQGYGFHQHDHDDGSRMLKKPGARFAPWAHQRPLEVTLATGGDGLDLTLRYDGFVAFDTGDLERQADRLARAFSAT